MVMDPDRIVFQTLVGIELEMIVVMICVAVMIMHDILAEQMVGERVAALLIVGHQTCSLHPRRRALCLAVIAWAIEQGQKYAFERARTDTESLRRPAPLAQIRAVYASHAA